MSNEGLVYLRYIIKQNRFRSSQYFNSSETEKYNNKKMRNY